LTFCKTKISTLLSQAVKSGVLALLFCAALVGAAGSAQAKYASMVVDADTGEVLHSVNADNRNYPASLTKMMTLFMLFDQMDAGKIRLGDQIPISAHASAQSPSKLGLEPGDSIQVEQAILGLCTKSANDVAVAIGEYIGGSEANFATLMTNKARELGMRQTTFRNASGLPNLQQMSTARDMTTLARALLHRHAKYYHYFSTRTFVYNGEPIRNHNHLMERYEGMDGIKTGFIGASGFNLVASAKRGNRRLVGVVFGGQSAAARDKHMAQLLDAAFARTPGSSGVELAEMPEQKSGDQSVAANDDEDNTGAVMKTMAKAKPVAAQKPAVQKIAAKSRKPVPDEVGDAEDDEEEDWGIQVGAFNQQGKARAAANSVMHKLGKLVSEGDVSVSKAGHGHHVTYRARIINLSEDAARQACKRLSKSHDSCKLLGGTNVASR